MTETALYDAATFTESRLVQCSKEMVEWYSRPEVLYAIRPFLVGKETALLTPKWVPVKKDTRYIHAHNTQSIQYWLFTVFHVQRSPVILQLYSSCANYEIDGSPGIPKFSSNLGSPERKQQTSEWRNSHWKHIKDYDFFLDIDSPTFAEEDMAAAKETMLAVHDFLKEPHRITFTGQGYHIVFQKPFVGDFDPEKLESAYSEMFLKADFFFRELSELIDPNLNDSRRVIKAPYSLAFYPERTMICWPINSEKEARDHDWKDYTLPGRLAGCGLREPRDRSPCVMPDSLKGRGVHWFNPREGLL